MNKSGIRVISGIKYIYLVFFFALLSGLFYPLITDTSFDNVVYGVLILFVGLVGAILVYNAAINHKRQGVFFGLGFCLIGISLYLIFIISAR